MVSPLSTGSERCVGWRQRFWHPAQQPFTRCIPIWVYNWRMARAPTTADAFNAIAEPRRRQILDLLARGERSVNSLVLELDLAQPYVSKHLRVLRAVGVVGVRDAGRQRLYRLNGRALKPIYEWISQYQQLWSDRFDRLDSVLEELKTEEHENASGE
jgi:DNA-binding transcriptional ArsR family regulator